MSGPLSTREAWAVAAAMLPALDGLMNLRPWLEAGEEPEPGERCVIALGFGIAEPLAVGATWEDALQSLARRSRDEIAAMTVMARAWARMRARQFIEAAAADAELTHASRPGKAVELDGELTQEFRRRLN